MDAALPLQRGHDLIAKLAGLHDGELAFGVAEVGRCNPSAEYAAHGVPYLAGLVFHAKALVEHEGHGADHAVGIGDALAGDVGGGAVGGFVVGFVGADAGGGHEAEGAEDAATEVAEDVAKHVFHDHDVKLAGVDDEGRGGGVDDDVLDFDFGIFDGHFFEYFVPEHAGFQHVALVHVVEDLLAAHGFFEGHVHDGVDLVFVVFEVLVDVAFACGVDAHFFFSEVEATDEFTNHHEVDAAFNHVGL